MLFMKIYSIGHFTKENSVSFWKSGEKNWTAMATRKLIIRQPSESYSSNGLLRRCLFTYSIEMKDQ